MGVAKVQVGVAKVQVDVANVVNPFMGIGIFSAAACLLHFLKLLAMYLLLKLVKFFANMLPATLPDI